MNNKIFYTIIAFTFVFTISKAQVIPNPGFENWTNMGSYNNPDNWSCLNNMTAGMGTYTCEKGTPGSGSATYLKLTSKTVAAGVVPGMAVCGVIDPATFMPVSGFPFTTRPGALIGKWQHMVYGSSQGFIDVKLTRWDAGTNKRVVVASAHQVLSGMAMSWANFNIPLTYTDANSPDSCIIVLASSGTTPTNNDYLWVDDLAFSGSSGLSGNYFNADINIFPNPSQSNLTIDLSGFTGQKVSFQIYDMQGRQVKKIEVLVDTSISNLDISDLLSGNYLLAIIAKEEIITRKFIKE